MILRFRCLDRESFCPKSHFAQFFGKWGVTHRCLTAKLESKTERELGFQVHPAAAVRAEFPGE